jgi:hypothetical protein
MNEEQRAYHELEMMQELGMLKKGTNIAKVLEDYVEDKKEVSASKEEQPQTFVELENHMVVGEYYKDYDYKKGKEE